MGGGRLTSLALVAAFALRFSALVVLPALRVQENLNPTIVSMFSSAVQFGFVVGTIVSAVIVLADRIDPVRFFTLLSLIAGRVINPRSARSWCGPTAS